MMPEVQPLPEVAPPPPVVEYARGQGGHRLAFRGTLTLREAGDIWTDVRQKVAHLRRGDRVELEMSQVEAVDGGTMALLVRHRSDLAARGVRAEFVGARENVQALIKLYAGDVKASRRKRLRRRPEGLFVQIGRATHVFFSELKALLAFIGELAVELGRVIKQPRTGNWREVPPTLERTGADALPIVVLINFLVGFVLAYQSATQLRQFGANIYVVDLVGKSITREMGPLMTAIILCGRSGAAFAAELGSMQVHEEVDALRTMGFGPMRFLVLPRLVALLIALPLLTLVADFAAILGGLLVGVTSLGLTLIGFTTQLVKVVTLWDVSSGVIKSVGFAFAIAIISCQQGFATRGGAEEVGRRTTASVVSILVALIVIDAAFTVLFHTYRYAK